MGLYINPANGQSKEEWLRLRGEKINVRDAVRYFVSNRAAEKIPVCLADNGMFKAAAVGYSLMEVQDFALSDGRHKQWFLVNISDLRDPSSGCAGDIAHFLD